MKGGAGEDWGEREVGDEGRGGRRWGLRLEVFVPLLGEVFGEDGVLDLLVYWSFLDTLVLRIICDLYTNFAVPIVGKR